MHAIIICKNNTVFAKSDFWSKTRQPAPVSPTLYQESLQMVQYPAYHMEECTIEQYNLGEIEGILPEADG